MKRYPLAALAEAMHVPLESLARELGMSGSTWQEYRDRGVSEKVADRLAAKAGIPAYTVWPELLEDNLAACERPCEECGGMFMPTNRAHRFCCRQCGRRNWFRRRYSTDPEFREKDRRKCDAYRAECGDYVRAQRMKRYWQNREQELARQRAYDAGRKAAKSAYMREYRLRKKAEGNAA